MDQIVSLETAKLAMEVGFKENVTHLYLDGENSVPAPTQTALSRWLREKNDMYVSVDMMAFKRGWIVYIISMPRKAVCFKAKDFDTYEEALEEGLKQACKIVKDRRGNDTMKLLKSILINL